MTGSVEIGALKRLGQLLAGQPKNAVAITGGTISGVTITGSTLTGNTITGSISGNTVRSSATVTKNANTTLANVTGLVQTVVPGTYAFTAKLAGTAGASGGWKLAFKYTTAVVSVLQATGIAYVAAGVAVSNTTTTTDQATLLGVTAANVAAEIYGTMVVTTGGTVQLQFAQNASDGTDCTIVLGSMMTFTRIA